VVKRILDITVALIGLIILAPVFVAIAILIRLDSPGPVFFRGRRVGQYGKTFYILKFRSMIPDAPQKGPAITCGDDPRITKIGRVLRKAKLDELPSLVNVLKGEMSLVGPRPEAPPWVERYTPQQRAVLTLKPGITGLAQIKYRNEEALLSSADLETDYPHIMNDKLSIDLGYMENRSFILDVYILLKTVVMLFGDPDLLKQYVRRIALDLVLIPFAFSLAWVIRFDCHPLSQELRTLTRYVLPIALIYIFINATFGVYRRLWAYASFRDVILLSKAVGLGTLILVVVNSALAYHYHYRLSTSGLIIGGLLTLTLSTIAKYRRQLTAMLSASWPRPTGPDPERVLIVGVNETAQQLAAQIYLGKSKTNYELVGFVDDDPNSKGMNINGVEILGTQDRVRTLVRDKQIDVIIIAHRPSDREEFRRLISACQETTAQIKVLPNIVDVIEGRYEDPLALQDVSIDDILGRAPATASLESCTRILAGKVVLVTGAAGSIGSELCRQILRLKPLLLLALDNNETGLYELNLQFSQNGRSPLQLIMADVADWHKVNRVFQQYRPQVVFHAAAYKHVHLVESHSDEALRVNVIGTVIVSEVAHRYEAERFVFISTDKAVNPRSVMGASKRIGELWMRAMSEQSDTIFTTVRFGNVIDSRGSVLPTFTRQIELGGPVTVTHPEMHRYFISIPEAISLVLQSATFGQSGEAFMLEMGEEVSVLDLAQRMIRLKGLRVHKDIEIEFVGMRPGEKLHEELAYDYELREETPHPRIYGLRCPDGLLDYDTLLGAILILTRSLRLPGGDQRICEGLFRIASRDIDGFLNQVAGLDLMRDYRQLSGREHAL
jgi:FlaA1/EpsC-like NDP-sugar epimerase/lipopolysaccharide/colanic/teichoic acid biosynthesis glycosyltransferase